MRNGILPINKDTLDILKQKHPKGKPAHENILLADTAEAIHPVKFESIYTESIRKGAIKSKGGSGPLGVVVNGLRKTILSKNFGASSNDFCFALANVTKQICTEKCGLVTLRVLLACRLIPINKNPGLRPICVGEILRKRIGKALVLAIKEHITS